MFRSVALAALLVATPCLAQTAPAADANAEHEEALRRDDPFVVSSDACGASRYKHLVGEEFAGVTEASLPDDTYVLGRGRVTTLEFQPARLNVTVGRDGRIIAIGCF